ncbi:hypothetical protein [Parahaliea mediterranea]|uniref:Uncharacterized protein n=1 Tax=Parahaliea mediterranea TaxID=651086 RepID=A0A939IKJ3_9GAMM|nr:hypothetical protein [Parahaliea mediterranea]MBN7795510.1 hypothetical protein [Parahaliea mediterranea]
MNVFGAFTFGNLIKTFLPGLIWLFGLVLLEASIAGFFDSAPAALWFIRSFPQVSLVLAIPFSILLGLFSNVIVFMGLNDVLVRNPSKRDPEGKNVHELYDLVCGKTRQFVWEPIKVDGDSEPSRNTDSPCVDAEVLVLHELGAAQLSFVREQYWSYVEFLMNLMLGLWVLTGAVLLRCLTAYPLAPALCITLPLLAASALVSCFLVKAARKNYQRHIAKMLSLILSVLSKQQRAEIAAARPGSS